MIKVTLEDLVKNDDAIWIITFFAKKRLKEQWPLSNILNQLVNQELEYEEREHHGDKIVDIIDLLCEDNLLSKKLQGRMLYYFITKENLNKITKVFNLNMENL